jgi:threonine/homoserine/homoserine lactone efflux protein
MIGIGHGIVEIPIIALVYFGFASYLDIPVVKMATGLAGGALLVVMGLLIFFTFRKPVEGAAGMPYNPLVTGIVMTGGNPYFFLWWATIGVALISGAVVFGIIGLVLFTVVHLVCDITWDQIVSMTVFRTRHLWTPKIQKIVFGICAAVLIGFGLLYIVSVLM